MSHILSLVTFLPLFGAAAIMAVRGTDRAIANYARWIALEFGTEASRESRRQVDGD